MSMELHGMGSINPEQLPPPSLPPPPNLPPIPQTNFLPAQAMKNGVPPKPTSLLKVPVNSDTLKGLRATTPRDFLFNFSTLSSLKPSTPLTSTQKPFTPHPPLKQPILPPPLIPTPHEQSSSPAPPTEPQSETMAKLTGQVTVRVFSNIETDKTPLDQKLVANQPIKLPEDSPLQQYLEPIKNYIAKCYFDKTKIGELIDLLKDKPELTEQLKQYIKGLDISVLFKENSLNKDEIQQLKHVLNSISDNSKKEEKIQTCKKDISGFTDIKELDNDNLELKYKKTKMIANRQFLMAYLEMVDTNWSKILIPPPPPPLV